MRRMREDGGEILYSASDLVNFLGCRHATFLDLRQLADPVTFDADPTTHELLQKKGLAHERAHLKRLRADGRRIAEIPDENLKLDTRIAATLAAMRDGAEVIYQGVLRDGSWHGYADFLVRTDDCTSAFGDYAYEIADTKLALSAKPKHAIQLCVYADLLARIQKVQPPRLHVVLGDNKVETLRTSDFIHYYGVARDRFLQFTATPPAKSEPERCAHCEFCRWKPSCEQHWLDVDHLNQVAGISSSQIAKLADAGIPTLAALAKAPATRKVPDLQADTYTRLHSQAALQFMKRETGKDEVEILPLVPGRGFERLPEPNVGDIFFDMEGDPLVNSGLEYLFGFVHVERDDIQFTDFWGHDSDGEKKAFEQAVDFITEQLKRHPGAHVYHYAAYEAAALKRLAMKHATREFAVDQLLRKGKLVDLYKAVREGIRISEPRYSIKNLETFYWKEKRAGDVTNAGESIVIYERWRETRENGLLEQIRDYNEVDCRSTLACRDWLLEHKPRTANWFTGPRVDPDEADREAKRLEAERQAQAAVDRLTSGSPPEDRGWRETLGHLLEFHRRAAKPTWWAMFERAEMSDEQLIDDVECLGGIVRDRKAKPVPFKQSLVYRFTFPPQDTKLRPGSEALRADTQEGVGEIVALDDVKGILELKLGAKRDAPPDRFALIPGGPIRDQVIREAVGRCADAVAGGKNAYPAILDILRKTPPRLRRRQPGSPIMPAGSDPVAGTIEAVQVLDSSYLLIQGPPGTGKTFTSAHAIVALLAAKKRVGVSSNSHKAIINLLREVERVAAEHKVKFQGAKKSTDEDDCLGGTQIVDVFKNEDAARAENQLVAGTAWLLARKEFEGTLDYLFVDEAGQVSLANVVAMGTSARNIILVGDQMQLAQPIQGVHPGESGASALDYLMGEWPTVPPDRGIFLEQTRRMHPDVCRFVSEAFYEGRLASSDDTKRQALVPSQKLGAIGLPTTGIRYVPVMHDGCSQRSEPEALQVAEIYSALLGEVWIDRHGKRSKIGLDDILVVSPYNMQVVEIAGQLPEGARVGTVDKFQGQEAAIVLVSMATSSAAEMPRGVEFLFSPNRLNVAISRARCVAVVLGNPALMEVSCATLEQMSLLSTFCRLNSVLASYGSAQ